MVFAASLLAGSVATANTGSASPGSVHCNNGQIQLSQDCRGLGLEPYLNQSDSKAPTIDSTQAGVLLACLREVRRLNLELAAASAPRCDAASDRAFALLSTIRGNEARVYAAAAGRAAQQRAYECLTKDAVNWNGIKYSNMSGYDYFCSHNPNWTGDAAAAY